MIMESTRAGPAFCDAAVPVSTKIPVPITEPMPSAVRLRGPRARRSVGRAASAWRSAMLRVVERAMLHRYGAHRRRIYGWNDRISSEYAYAPRANASASGDHQAGRVIGGGGA